jgi:hypothetical protein
VVVASGWLVGLAHRRARCAAPDDSVSSGMPHRSVEHEGGGGPVYLAAA